MSGDPGIDMIRPLLTAHPAGGGVVHDWARLYRDGGADGAVRHIFENAALGRTLCVEQYPEGRFAVVPAPSSLHRPMKASDFVPAISRSRAQRRAAREFMKLFATLAGDEGCDDDAEAQMEKLARQAGRALANRFLFALSVTDGDGSPIWSVTPAAYWKHEKFMYDGWIPGLDGIIPADARLLFDNTYEMAGPGSILEQAGKFLKAGFLWRRGFQDFIDRDALLFIAAMERPRAARSPAGNSPLTTAPALP